MPELKEARRLHASCVHDEFVYVFCGQNPATKATINSIERLDSQDIQEWELIEIPEAQLSPRYALAVTPINDIEILLLGGKGINNQEYH